MENFNTAEKKYFCYCLRIIHMSSDTHIQEFKNNRNTMQEFKNIVFKILNNRSKKFSSRHKTFLNRIYFFLLKGKI